MPRPTTGTSEASTAPARSFNRDGIDPMTSRPLPATAQGRFPVGWLVACAIGASFAPPVLAAPADRPPNIVFIFSDDHAYQAIGAYNDPRRLVETPHIDRIGREGMRFDRCVVPNSICGPSRATVLTGKYSHLNGFATNGPKERFDGSQ